MADNRVGFLICCILFLSVIDPKVYSAFPVLYEYIHLSVIIMFVVEVSPYVYRFVGI